MEAIIFFNETSMNGKYQVMTSLLLEGEGIRRVTVEPLGVHEHHNKFYNKMHNYWVSKEQLENIKQKEGATRTSF